jgi:hypothetical protein
MFVMANIGTTFSGILVFIGFCLLAIGISDGGMAAIIGIGLMAVGFAGIAISG